MRMLFVLILPFLSLLPLPVKADGYRIASSDPVMERILGPIVQEAYKRIGLDVAFERYPGERALLKSNNGEVDAELAREERITEIYPNLIPVPVPLGTFNAVVFCREPLASVTSWESLRPFSLGVEIGVKFAETGTRGMHVQPFSDRGKMFALLAIGRLDAVVHVEETGREELEKLHLNNVHMHTPPLERMQFYHFVNRKNALLIPMLVNALKSMAADGTLSTLQSEHD